MKELKVRCAITGRVITKINNGSVFVTMVNGCLNVAVAKNSGAIQILSNQKNYKIAY